MIDSDSDQWLLNGKCSICRRRKYCGKECTASKRAKDAMIKQMIMESTGIGVIYNAIKRGCDNG